MMRFLSVFLAVLVISAWAFAQTPPTPTDLRVSPLPNTTHLGAMLTWRADHGNFQFHVYRSAADSSHFALLATVPAPSYVDTTVVRGTRFYYYVKSFRDTLVSGRSNIANILFEIPPPLPTPTNLTAVNAPHMFEPSVQLNWSAPRGPWNFRVYRSTNDTLRYHLIATIPDTIFGDRSVRVDSNYNYYVQAASKIDPSVSPRSNVASVHVTVPPRIQGTISGTIIDDSTSAPLRHVNMSFFRSSASNWGCQGVFTDSLGHYSALLDTGRYIIRATAPGDHNTLGYRPEYYNNCFEPSCATVVTVGENTTFTANMGLSRLTPPSYVYVSGTVTDTANHALRNARVSVIRTMQEMNFLSSLGFTPGIGSEAMNLEGVGHTRGVIWNGLTDSLGHYRARVLSNNSYIALASKETYLPEYYNNKPTAELADIIVLTNRDTSGIDFSLAVRPVPNSSISGVVKDSLGTRVPSRITILRAGNNHSTFRYGHTDSLGAYSITGLEAGKYFVLASPFSGYGPAFYKAGAYGVIRIQDADTVIAGNATGIDVGVRPVTSAGLAVIRGTIRSTSNAVIEGVRVSALDASGNLLGIGVTDIRGTYELDAVAPGTATVVADRDGYNSSQTTVFIGTTTYTLDNVNIAMTPDGLTSVGGTSVAPVTFALNQNYPNPFNPSTTISFEVPAASRVHLQIFNVLGQEVSSLVNDEVAAGTFSIVWNGKDNSGHSVASGIYFYKMQATAPAGGKEFSSVRKMLLLK